MGCKCSRSLCVSFRSLKDAAAQYDIAYSWMIGKEVNDPFYAKHPERFAPWDRARRVVFFPNPFSSSTWKVPPNKTTGEAGDVLSGVTLKHFVAYVKGSADIRLNGTNEFVRAKSDDVDALAAPRCAGEVLENGLCLPAEWPPQRKSIDRTYRSPPYLQPANRPHTINVTAGRQLFVDDWLIANSSGITIEHHTAELMPEPVITGTEDHEMLPSGAGSMLWPAHQGVYFDPAFGDYRLLYGCVEFTCLATSKDGRTWTKGKYDVIPGTNVVSLHPSGSAWLDTAAPHSSARRYWQQGTAACSNSSRFNYTAWSNCFILSSSPNGIHWRVEHDTTHDLNTHGLAAGEDSTTFFYNPFRRKFVWPIKSECWNASSNSCAEPCPCAPRGSRCSPRLGRQKLYWEADNLTTGYSWTSNQPVPWAGSDDLDPPPACWNAVGTSDLTAELTTRGRQLSASVAARGLPNGHACDPAAHACQHCCLMNHTCGVCPACPPCLHGHGPSVSQLYDLGAYPYESVLVGLFQILTGKGCSPPRPFGRGGEQDEVHVAFSRDGFHWSRPPPPSNATHRVAFLAMGKTRGNWNYQNMHAGGFVVLNNSLTFYVGGRSGSCSGAPRCDANAEFLANTPSGGNGTIGIGVARRDGFASVLATEPTGVLLTPPLSFSGAKQHLFINAATVSGGSVAVEVMDATTDAVVEPFSLQHCERFAGDSTRAELSWGAGTEAATKQLKGQRIRLRFTLQGTGTRLFSFWFSETACGESGGFVGGGGGPGFGGPRDERGSCA